MGTLLVVRNLAALGLLVALAAWFVWAVKDGPIGPSVAGFFKKRREYYDVERMDDAEILARKYSKKPRKRGSK